MDTASNFVSFEPVDTYSNTDATVQVRTLAEKLTLHCPSVDVANRLRLIDARPTIEGVDFEERDLTVEDRAGFLHLPITSDTEFSGCAQTLLGDLHMYHKALSRKQFPQALMLHGASLDVQGGMIILLGYKGGGKSTLTCAMGLAGARVLGDEHVVLDGDQAIARPRTMRVKCGSLQVLPKSFGHEVERHPHVKDWHGFRIFSVPPSVFGSPWHLSWLPVRAIVALQGNHGGTSSMRTATVEDMMPLVMDNLLVPKQGVPKALGDLRMLLARTTLLELRNGDLEQAVRLLYSL